MKKKALYNIVASFFLEAVTIVCAFILPKMIISGFGSEYNGIVSSVTQFLSVVTLLRAGVGGVTRAALYKPLTENDVDTISAILKSTEHFMRRVSYIFVAFLFLFAAVYPVLVSKEFEYFFSFSLVLILGINTFAQYYFGITYQFLLMADQKNYVYSVLQTVATILNTVFSVLLINCGVEFRLMKLVSALVFAAIPIALYWYVHKNYKLSRDVQRDDTYIKQRWDAFAHQVATFIHSNTALMLLTVFSDLYQVSIYSVYYMVVNGVKKFMSIFSSGIEAALGKLMATKDDKKLDLGVSIYELGINIISIITFTCSAILIVPFVQVYTIGITDTDYINPVFGYLLCLAFFFSCVRMPYQSVVEAAGHFKGTRNAAFLEAAINIVVSLLLVKKYGCIGVAAGTAVSMIFRTAQYGVYATKNILKRSYLYLIKRAVVTLTNIAIIIVPYLLFDINAFLCSYASHYLDWAVEAVIVFVVVSAVTLIMNIVFYHNTFAQFIRILKTKKR